MVEGPSPVSKNEVLGTPSAIPFNYDCFGEGLPQEGEEVWASTGVVEGPILVGRTEVLGTPSVIRPITIVSAKACPGRSGRTSEI